MQKLNHNRRAQEDECLACLVTYLYFIIETLKCPKAWACILTDVTRIKYIFFSKMRGKK